MAHGRNPFNRVIRSTIVVATEGRAESVAETDRVDTPHYGSELDAQDVLVKLGTIIPGLNLSLRLYSSSADDERSVAVWGLSEESTRRLSAFDPDTAAGVLLDWNRRLRFLALDEPEQALQRLLAELVRLAALASSTGQLLLLRIEYR